MRTEFKRVMIFVKNLKWRLFFIVLIMFDSPIMQTSHIYFRRCHLISVKQNKYNETDVHTKVYLKKSKSSSTF